MLVGNNDERSVMVCLGLKTQTRATLQENMYIYENQPPFYGICIYTCIHHPPEKVHGPTVALVRVEEDSVDVADVSILIMRNPCYHEALKLSSLADNFAPTPSAGCAVRGKEIAEPEKQFTDNASSRSRSFAAIFFCHSSSVPCM